ncbi:MAG: glutathione peroxidase [Catalinimonas sp.]
MKHLLFTALLLAGCAQTQTRPTAFDETPVSETTHTPMQSETSFYDFKMTTLEGEEVDFSKYRGKKVLIVNTASKCGYTPQYAGLEELNQKHGDEVVVLGFPANNFGGQEPGSNGEIAEFCERNYGVAFTMFEKSSVKGDDMNPLYRWLTDKSQNGWNEQAPQWNFNKYLIDEKGKLIKYFPSNVKPMSDELLEAVRS